MSTTRFQYVAISRRRNPIIIAYTHDEEGGMIFVTFGASFCHENDRFSRRLGRQIAEGRMNHSPMHFTVPFDGEMSFGQTITSGIRTYVEENHHHISIGYSNRTTDNDLDFTTEGQPLSSSEEVVSILSTGLGEHSLDLGNLAVEYDVAGAVAV